MGCFVRERVRQQLPSSRSPLTLRSHWLAVRVWSVVSVGVSSRLRSVSTSDALCLHPMGCFGLLAVTDSRFSVAVPRRCCPTLNAATAFLKS